MYFVHRTPLHIAAENGSIAIVELLLRRPDIEINCVDIYPDD